MLDKLQEIERRYEALGEELGTTEVLTDPAELRRVSKARASIEPVVTMYRELAGVLAELEGVREILREEKDQEMLDLAAAEQEELEARRQRLEQDLTLALLPRDPNEDKDVIIVEIRAGTGGDEAALFAGDLFRMYSRYAERRGWKTEIIDANLGGMGGYKEVVFSIQGAGSYRMLKHESGVHRVQRVPATESAGRIHTSTATVAVLPEPEEVELEINPADLKIETYRSSSAGGQHVQKTESAIRITHLPTGLIATCQDERSQHQNKEKAMRVLRAHLLERMQREQQSEIAAARKSQVGGGERSEKIRTYNFPQDRVTDHRIGMTFHHMPSLLDGEIEDIVVALAEAERARLLEEIGKTA